MCISDKHNLKPSPIVCLQRLIRRNHWSCTDQERHQRVEQIISKLISRYQEKNWSQRPLMAAVIGGRSGRHRRPWWPSYAAGWPSSAAGVAVSGRGGRQCGQGGRQGSQGGRQWPGWPSATARVAACSSRCGHQQQPGWLPAAAGVAINWARWPSAAAKGGHQQQPGWPPAAAGVAVSSSLGGCLQQPV